MELDDAHTTIYQSYREEKTFCRFPVAACNDRPSREIYALMDVRPYRRAGTLPRIIFVHKWTRINTDRAKI